MPPNSNMGSDSEREIILEPGTRYLVVKTEPGEHSHKTYVDVIALPPTKFALEKE